MPLRILLADDHIVVREGFRKLLESHGFVIVGEASHGEEASRLCERLQPDVAVLDFGMPHMNGIVAAAEIRRVSPATLIVILSMHSEDHYILEALHAGIRGYVLKSSAANDLLRAIREIVAGNVYLSPRISGAVVKAFLSGTKSPAEKLTTRERQILQLLAEGRTNKEVAADVGISPKTVESHRAKIMKKLGIHDTAGLVRYAIRRGLIEPLLFLFQVSEFVELLM